MSSFVTARLAVLVASMRAGGARPRGPPREADRAPRAHEAVAPHTADPAARRPPGPPAHRARFPPLRRRAAREALARADGEAATGRARVRRVRLDGPVRADAA